MKEIIQSKLHILEGKGDPRLERRGEKSATMISACMLCVCENVQSQWIFP